LEGVNNEIPDKNKKEHMILGLNNKISVKEHNGHRRAHL
jgi:hypothetical protein